MLIDNLLIKRLSYLEKIDSITETLRKKTGCPIPNVSGWEIGDDYRDIMLQHFDYPKYANFNPIDYFYSYNLIEKEQKKLIDRFGGNLNSSLLLTNNNTISLINAVNFIAKFCPSQIGLLLPCYFTIPNLLKNRKLTFKNFTAIRNEAGYSLPKDEIIHNECKVLILTNPVFSTGKYLSEDDLDFIYDFLSRGNYVVSDESLAAPGRELIRIFGTSKNFVGIYSPHKFIHFNSFKFSCMLFNERFEDFFDQWNDVYSGSLNVTNLQALSHFLSDNYDIVLNQFFMFTEKKRIKLINLLSNFPSFNTDIGCVGDFQCIYSKNIPFEAGNNLSFIKNIIKNTNAIFYPGTLHGFQKKHGFVFRVNLVSYTEIVENALLKILFYLTNM